MTNIERWKKAKKTRDRWLEYAFIIGFLGFINIITNVNQLNWGSLAIGIRIGLFVYAIIIVTCVGQALRYHLYMKKLDP